MPSLRKPALHMPAIRMPKMTARRIGAVGIGAAVAGGLVAIALIATSGPSPSTPTHIDAAPAAGAPIGGDAATPRAKPKPAEIRVDNAKVNPAVKVTPTSVTVPKINANSSLIPLGLRSNGSLQTPPATTPMQAGWYSLGPAPGQVGPSVLVGHTEGDHQQPGIFAHLTDVKAGDPIYVHRADGSTLRFVVDRTMDVPKDHFPTAAVYGKTTRPELRLITTTDDVGQPTKSNQDNIIVFASLR